MSIKAKIISSMTLLAVGIITIYAGYIWFLARQARVDLGLSSPDFPYRDYTEEQLDKMFPQYVVFDVPTTQTPEQTHRLFVDALKKQNFDEAVKCCFREGDWERMKTMFENIKNKGQLPVMINDVGKIEKDIMNSSTATYLYEGTIVGGKVANFMTFIKTSDGRWLIESL